MKKLYDYILKRPILIFALIVLLSHGALTLCAWQVRTHVGFFAGYNSDTQFVPAAQNNRPIKAYWSHFDSAYYEAIAEKGYLYDDSGRAKLTAAFFPLYPYSLRFVAGAVGDTESAGIVLGLIVSTLIGYFAYLSLWVKGHKKSALTAAVILIVLPQMFYTGAVLSDGTFLLLSLIGVYSLHKKWFWRAAVVACALPLTKLLGILFVIPLFGALYNEYGRVLKLKQYAPLLGSMAGGILVMLHNYRIAGDPLYFMKVVSREWGRTNNAAGVFTKPFQSASLAVLTLVAISVLGVIIAKRRKLGLWWTLWGVLLVLIPLLSSPLGQVRYAVANVPFLLDLFYVVSDLKKPWRIGFVILSILGYLLLGTLWMLDHPILQ